MCKGTLLAVAVAWLPSVCGCGFGSFQDLVGIEEICCGGMAQPDCSAGFPSVCSFECAELLVPFADECVKMMEGMPAGNFPFALGEMITFTAGCRQTTELKHYSSDTCTKSAEQLEERVLDVNNMCCTQDGVFSCGSNGGQFDDVPWGCNARCAVSFIPFYDECFDGMTVTTVDELEKYNLLYEQCANQPEDQVVMMIDMVDTFLRNPNCTINVTGVTTRSGNYSVNRNMVPPCTDDDATLQTSYPGQTCADASTGGACDMVGITEACGCSCSTTAVTMPCDDDNPGLAALMGDPSFTCLAAAASGFGCDMVGVADLCTCACPASAAGASGPPPGDGGGGHRRNERRRLQDGSHLIVPPLAGELITSQACPLADFLPRLQTVTNVCCGGQGGCNGNVPLACSFDCGREFNRFIGQCEDLLAVFVPIYMPLYHEFASSCAQLDPRSLATAIHYAKCAECGDNYVDDFAGEQCDDGDQNGHGSCSTECKICSADRRLPSGGCIPEGTDVWHSEGTSWAHNKAGHTFTLYLLPEPSLYTFDESGADLYYDQCAQFGMLPAGNGNSDYSDYCATPGTRGASSCESDPNDCGANGCGCASTGADAAVWVDASECPCAVFTAAPAGGVSSCCASYTPGPIHECMPMVPSGWGTGNDCDNNIHDNLGWWDFIILQPAANDWKPFNYPDDGGSWSIEKRPICATDDDVVGTVTHPTGKVKDMESCDANLRISGGTSGLPAGGCVPTGTTIWHSEGTTWPTNKAGNTMTVYMLPESEIWSNDHQHADRYLEVCAKHGMLPMGNGNSNYCDNCEERKRCVCGWSSSFGDASDFDNNINSKIGWRHFIVLKWTAGLSGWKPINYPGDEGSWENMKRPVCVTDDVLHGIVTHPTGIVPLREVNCPADRQLPSGACVPVGTDIWHSEGTTWATNQVGNAFTLYLLPDESNWAHDEDSADRYLEVCAEHGMLPAGNGHSSNSNTCRDQGRCMPMVPDDWGADADYDDHIHDNLGWNNFIILQWGDNWKPINHPFDDSQWEAMKRPICATDDLIHGVVTHPSGAVQQLDAFGR